jgi:hypothetical protein
MKTIKTIDLYVNIVLMAGCSIAILLNQVNLIKTYFVVGGVSETVAVPALATLIPNRITTSMNKIRNIGESFVLRVRISRSSVSM